MNVQRTLLVPALLLLASCSGSSSGSGQSLSTPAEFSQSYKLADGELPGWSQDKGSGALEVYTDQNLEVKIDGGAGKYLDQGMKLAMYQELVGPDPQTCILTVMDFVTDKNAESMFDTMKDKQSATLGIPPYDGSVAMASTNLTGITALAWFKRVYIELSLDGFGSDTEMATQVAGRFMAKIETRMKSQ
jgi:hypothetical protein